MRRGAYAAIAIGALLVTASELLLKQGATHGALRSPFTYRQLALSQSRHLRALKSIRRAARDLALPSPHLITRPILWLVLAARGAWHWCRASAAR